MPSSVKTTQNKKFSDEIDKAQKRIDEAFKDACDYFRERATQYVAKDTSHLMKAIPFLTDDEIVRAMRASWTVGTEGSAGYLVGQLRLRVPYAAAMEFGASPHMPPVEPLIQWARRHGMKNPRRAGWALAKHIEKDGMDPHPFIRPALRDARDYFYSRLKNEDHGPSGGASGAGMSGVTDMITKASSFGDRLFAYGMRGIERGVRAAGGGRILGAAKRRL